MRMSSIFLMSAFCAGCASTVSDGFEAAPEWFKERQEQLAGEGYPSFEQAAPLDSQVDRAPWSRISRDLNFQYKQIQNADLDAVSVTEAEMRAWVEEQRALVAKGEEPY